MIFTQNIAPELLTIGSLNIRWYGICFALGLTLAYIYTTWIFKRENLKTSDLDSVAVYLFFGMLIGARLGHVFFYEFDYYKENLLNIFKIWNGGLSSHGATIGLLVSYLIWIKVKKVNFSKYADLLILGIPLVAAFVRIGNFFNSEILGKVTNSDYGVIFKFIGENIPRHPVQLYESLSNFIIFIILFVAYKKLYKKFPKLFLLFLYVLIYFISRFIIEFWKEKYILLDFPLSMGQILSIIPIIISIIYFSFFFKKPTSGEL